MSTHWCMPLSHLQKPHLDSVFAYNVEECGILPSGSGSAWLISARGCKVDPRRCSRYVCDITHWEVVIGIEVLKGSNWALNNSSHRSLTPRLGMVAEVVEHTGLACGTLWDRTHGRVKPMTYNIDTCCFLSRCLVLLGEGKDWFAQWQENVTERCQQVMMPVTWYPSEAALYSYQE